jgi:hypothetical protein
MLSRFHPGKRMAKPSKKANWQRIRLMTEVPNADLVRPGKVWVALCQQLRCKATPMVRPPWRQFLCCKILGQNIRTG